MLARIRLFLAPLCAAALLAAVAPSSVAPSPSSAPRTASTPQARSSPPPRVAGPPAAPPDGTYVYALSRNGTDQGQTTVVVLRREEAATIDTNEAGAAGAARAQIVASFRYKDLGIDSYVASYEAPFLRTSPLGRPSAMRSHPQGSATVRYHFTADGASASIDGARGTDTFAQRDAWIFDAPFMTGAMFVPALRHRSGRAQIAPVSEAFDEGPSDAAPERYVSTAPHAPKTPKTDAALEVTGVATLWFDRGNYIVHEAYFDRINLDARLVSYSRTADVASFEPAATPTPRPRLVNLAATFASDDGTKLAGVLDLPASGKAHAAAVVFVPAGPGGTRDFGGDGPAPMYPDLAITFAQRGYAVFRYDSRGMGKSEGSSDATWAQSLADAEAAIAYAESQEEVDPAQVYVLGYGTGADLALTASSATDTTVAGVIALAPTAISYRDCAQRTKSSEKDAFSKTAAAHDPRALAARSRVPLFVLHPGVGLCGETKDEVAAYDEQLRSSNPRTTSVSANDLSARFGGLYDADSTVDTEEFFPYRFDPSTSGAIADWLDNPKIAVPGAAPAAPSARAPAPPPPPPLSNPDMNGEMPNPHVSATPDRGAAPGVVLPPGMTPPTYQPQTEPSPSPAPASS
jgi:alpha/beta superfamily hydrolase